VTSKQGTLFVVATPLGNLGDLSPRAADVLREVEVVAAEDTRRSRKLLGHVNAHPRVLSFHAHSPPARIDELLALLGEGKTVALLTDAGTPAVSDPGGVLVDRARARGAAVVAIPGPSAVVAALSVSGLPADRFTFLGFPPRRGRGRTQILREAAESPRTVVLFEAANRLLALLDDLTGVCGADRRAVVTRELTKVYEEVRAGTLAELAGYYRETALKGEITLVVAGRPAVPKIVDEEVIRVRAREMLAQGGSRRDVAARLANELHVSRKETYRVVTSL
jgi:16S rRNA (cytidine1402-2'-O)-methyltransferase